MRYFWVLGIFVWSFAVRAECPPVSEAAGQLIERHVQETKGAEYCRFRQVFKQNDVELLLYTIEGPCYKHGGRPGSCGNFYFRSMVGIVGGKEYPPVVIGGKGVFHSKAIHYSDGLITIEGRSYKKTDPQCCPSIESRLQYKIGATGFEKIEP